DLMASAELSQVSKSIHGEYDTMSEEEIDKLFEVLKILATKKEKQMFNKSDLEGKRVVIKKFWDDRDPDTSTPVNEFKRDFFKRLNYANAQFSGLREGWKTDRGRVLIQYGIPDEIERFPSSINTKAYEIWNYYDLEGGVIFVFVDIQGFSSYELVHSTARNELKDYNWQRWINVLSTERGSIFE
ncbi:MAG: GWxTD domain-containing protein, partial [Fidelibacterota bacterium]